MKAYHTISGLLFATVGGMHLWRAVQGWDMNIGTYAVSVTSSYVICGLCTVMAAWAFTTMNKR